MDNPNIDADKRHFQRIPFIADVVVELEDKKWNCQLIDISLKGFLIEPPENIAPETDVQYFIRLILSENVVISSHAEIAHTETTYWGFKWLDIDIDSFSSLRRLLEHNMTDPRQISRELADLMDSQ